MYVEVIWGDNVMSHAGYAKNVKEKLCKDGFGKIKLEIVGEHSGHNIYKLVGRCSSLDAAIAFCKTSLNELENEYGVRVHTTLKFDRHDLRKVLLDLVSL